MSSKYTILLISLCGTLSLLAIFAYLAISMATLESPFPNNDDGKAVDTWRNFQITIVLLRVSVCVVLLCITIGLIVAIRKDRAKKANCHSHRKPSQSEDANKDNLDSTEGSA